ncbi:MAG: hypothetical protein AB1760_01495 [Pseudomonadota bacterium]
MVKLDSEADRPALAEELSEAIQEYRALVMSVRSALEGLELLLIRAEQRLTDLEARDSHRSG